MRMLADDVAGLMDYLKLDKAYVMGVSMGGMIAQHVAIAYPERVKKLILASTLPRALGDGGGGFAPEVVKALGFSGGYTEEDARSLPVGKALGAVVAFAFNKPLYRIPAVIASWVYPKVINMQGVAGQSDAIMGHNTLESLHAIKAPTLVIAGTRDRIISPLASEEMARRIPNAKLVLIEGGSHAAILESRVRFNREVLDFLLA
jgi:pimeloyl-ACP methyl ester carboxylesterase